MSITLKKPFYTLKIQSEYCGYYASINGCYVDVNRHGEPQTIEYPVNQWLRNGENQISIYFLNTSIPDTDIMDFYPSARFLCSLNVRENDGGLVYEVARLCLDSSKLPRDDEDYIMYDKITEVLDICQGTTSAGTYSLGTDGLIENANGEIKVGNIPPIVESDFAEAPLLTLPVSLRVPFPEWTFFLVKINDFIAISVTMNGMQ